MDYIKHLEQLFDDDIIDLEQIAYLAQKEALYRGIKFSASNGVILHYQESNKLINNNNKALNYVFNHSFYINEHTSIRNKLAKIILFPKETLLIKIFYKDIVINEKYYEFLSEHSMKISFKDICPLSESGFYDIQHLVVQVQLIQASNLRYLAEIQDNIYDSRAAINSYLKTLKEQLLVLDTYNKKEILKERIKLWGFSEFYTDLIQHLNDPLIKMKDVYLAGLMSYHFLNDMSNDEITELNALNKSYLQKIEILSNILKNNEIIWVKN